MLADIYRSERTGAIEVSAMVAGEQGPGLKVEERRAQIELKLNSKWAPHQGYNGP